MVEISGREIKTATVTKANDMPEGELFSFKSEVHDFGTDDDGDPITVNVVSSNPKQHAGLQAVDYFLWALQRFYEKGEDRFWRFVWPKVRVVHDLDDTREHSFGTIYTAQKPLTLEARAKK